MTRWPHQAKAVVDVLAAIQDGYRKIVVTTPTGGGKTLEMFDLAQSYLAQEKRVAIYTNRKLLIEQLIRGLNAAEFDFGVRASGHFDERDKPLQISSIPTENARVFKAKRWTLHRSGLALFDEAHLQKGAVAQKVIDAHIESGAVVVSFTATPIDLGDIYDLLITAGTNSELRACGALVPAKHYGCDEPDLKHIGKVALNKLDSGVDLTEEENVKAIMVPGVYARVCEWYRRLNPQGKPTLLFAPGVRESIWFAEEFTKRGIRFAHIDGESIWIDGNTIPSTPERRADIIRMSANGEVKGISNRFVMREGIDMPNLAHGIFATVFGSLQSYLQAGGRLLRAHPSLKFVTIGDHGGNYHRHGSLNADRVWQLGQSSRVIAGLHFDDWVDPESKTPKPFLCPECKAVLVFREVSDGITGKCPECGAEIDFRKRSRPVVQSDGTLAEHPGDAYTPRVERMKPNTQELWIKIYWRAKKSKSGMTFRQARGLFVHENHYWPPKDLCLMPKNNIDWYAKVKDVPKEELR